MRNGTKKHKNATEYDKKKTKNKKVEKHKNTYDSCRHGQL